jgi:mono/diheme cytochrome c family protein
MSLRLSTAVLLCLAVSACGSDRAQKRGAEIYARNCAICHGADKRGGGGAGVEGLSRTPADLTVLSSRNGGMFPRAEVLVIVENYSNGRQPGRIMRPLAALTSEDRSRVRTEDGRKRVPAAQAALLAYLEAVQRP